MGRFAPPASHCHRAEASGGQTGYRRRRPEESVLYSVVQGALATFLARAHGRERPVPRFVERELRAFLRCGILAHGFVRVHCDGCGLDRVVAFSCKGRGFCPSCGGHRMADTAAHLVDRVLPEVPVRQWVLSLPFALRYRLAYDAPLASAVLEIFVRTVFASLRRRARKQWDVARAQCGAVTFVQRFGDALNLNVHFHPLPPPDDAEVGRVAGQVARRIVRLLERCGLAPDADPAEADPLADEQPLLAQLYAATVAARRRPAPLPAEASLARRHHPRQVAVGGARSCDALDPSSPEAAGSAASVRAQTASGLAPDSSESEPAPAPLRQPSPPETSRPDRPRRLAWADLLRRVFAIDILECPRCGSRTRILAAIHPPDSTRAILECLALPSRAPPAAAARPEDDDEGGRDP